MLTDSKAPAGGPRSSSADATTPGARAATAEGSRRGAGNSPRKSLAQGTKNAGKSTKRTGPSAKPTWTKEQARQILTQTAYECVRAGLNIHGYNSKVGSVVIELSGHKIVDGEIQPIAEADHA